MKRTRTHPAIVRYGIYLYFSSRSFRLAARCLSLRGYFDKLVVVSVISLSRQPPPALAMSLGQDRSLTVAALHTTLSFSVANAPEL